MYIPSGLLKRGSSGMVVKDLQRELAQAGFSPHGTDGIFGANTEAAVKAFQRARHLSADGIVGKKTWTALGGDRFDAAHNPGCSGTAGISAKGKAQMQALLNAARGRAGGQYPGGWCLAAVWEDIKDVGFGKLPSGFGGPLEYAYQFAEWLNQGTNAHQVGLKKIPCDNPYQAPAGSIVVVRAGTPGTHHPFAGDIVVRGNDDHLYNDGEMGYGGPGNFYAGNDYVLGCYVPE